MMSLMPNKENKSIGKLRHQEYYDKEVEFQELYERSKNGEIFNDLISKIFDDENILLAYRNIKKNGGFKTPGTDGLSIEDIAKMKPDEVIQKVKDIVFNKNGYHPRPVKRKDIPKPNGKLRPLGIPAIWDRLIQQCIEYYDNKISLYSAQNGKCAISGIVFQEVDEIHTHHKIPKSQGGKDNYQNLILIRDDYHRLIHSSQKETIIDYIMKLQVDASQLRKINALRNKMGLKEINKTYTQLKKISKIDDVQILD